MHNAMRRSLLKGMGSAGLVATAVSAGLLRQTCSFAGDWRKAAFGSRSVSDVFMNLGVSDVTESKDILIKAPDIAENGAVVPVEVTSKLSGTQSIAILVDRNATPLISDFSLSNGAEGYVSIRIKMAQTSIIRAVVTAGGKCYTASKEVKVTIGGCGG